MAILKVHYEGLDWYLYLYFIKSLGHHKNSLAIIIYVGETGFEFVMVMILNMFQLVHDGGLFTMRFSNVASIQMNVFCFLVDSLSDLDVSP